MYHKDHNNPIKAIHSDVSVNPNLNDPVEFFKSNPHYEDVYKSKFETNAPKITAYLNLRSLDRTNSSTSDLSTCNFNVRIPNITGRLFKLFWTGLFMKNTDNGASANNVYSVNLLEIPRQHSYGSDRNGTSSCLGFLTNYVAENKFGGYCALVRPDQLSSLTVQLKPIDNTVTTTVTNPWAIEFYLIEV